jgi:hypothetical protein
MANEDREGLGPEVFPPGVDPRDYPPYTMSPSEEAATVGRYVVDQVPAQAPVLDVPSHELATGRTAAAPHGTVFVRDEDAKPGKRVPAVEAAVAAQSEAVRSSTPDMVEPEDGGHLSEEAKGAKSGSFQDRKAPEVGFGALPPETVEKLDAKEEEMVLARQGVKTPDQQVLAEPAKPADPESVDAAFEVTAASEAHAAEDAPEPTEDVSGELTRTPEEQVEANVAAEPEGEESAETKAAQAAVADEGESKPDYNEKTVADLRTELGKRGVDYEYSARKADLVALLEGDDNKAR